MRTTSRPDYAGQAMLKLEQTLPREDWLRVKDVADALRKSKDTIHAHVECGDFFAGNRGPDGQQKIWRQSVIDWMRNDLAKES